MTYKVIRKQLNQLGDAAGNVTLAPNLDPYSPVYKAAYVDVELEIKVRYI